MVTAEQITTYYLYHLEELLPADEAEDLMRRVKEEVRSRERYDEAPITITEVHKMALESNRSEVVYETQLLWVTKPRVCRRKLANFGFKKNIS